MPKDSLNYHLNTVVTSIDSANKTVTTSSSTIVPYDILVLATGSDAVLPRHTPGHDAKGVFVYRTVEDLQKLIAFAATKKGGTGAVVGGGLLGLEAAKAMMDLEAFGKVQLIERNRWVLSRQLDGDAGAMVVEQVRALGLDVLLSKRVGRVEVNEEGGVKGVQFEDGERMDCECICFAVSQYIFLRKSVLTDDFRSVSKHGMNWREEQASSAQIEGAASLSALISRRQYRISTRSASAQAGRTRHLG